jgi:mannose-6-phosphate isomerase-like protein (cupin superfamily)
MKAPHRASAPRSRHRRFFIRRRTRRGRARIEPTTNGERRKEKISAVSTPGNAPKGQLLQVAHAFDIAGAKSRLAERGGYEIVHSSSGLEIGVYVLVAPEPDHQQPHADDEVYIVLEGQGTLEVEGARVDLHVGEATFVPAGAKHQFVGYEQLSVLVIFDKGPR